MSAAGASARITPAHAGPCPQRAPSSSGGPTVVPSSSSEIATAPATAPTAGWSGSTPLSRTQTFTLSPVALPNAHSRSTRSGSGCRARSRRTRRSRATRPDARRRRARGPQRSRRSLSEELLELHGRAHVALALQLARHVGRRRVLLARHDLLEGLARRGDRCVCLPCTRLDVDRAVTDVDVPLALAVDVEHVRVAHPGELGRVSTRLEAVEEVLGWH